MDRSSRRPLFAAAPLALALVACTPNPRGEPREGAGREAAVSVTEPATIAVTALAPEPWPEPPPAVAVEQGPGRAPLSLTASDGTGLRLVSLGARAAVEGPLALTELHLVFENPEDRQIEGRFEIEMPPGAAISRFAMLIDGRWQEGEVVERQAARAAYEDFLHRRQDPALLENSAGNAFSARVFPIPARGRKELIVAYSQELVGSREPYRLPLRGLGELDVLDARLVVREPSSPGSAAAAARTYELRRERFTPSRDLELVPSAAASGLRHGRLAVARVATAGAMPPAPVGSLVVLFDTSASRALGFAAAIDRLRDVLADLRRESGEDFDLRIVAFDQERAEIYSGKASGLGEVELGRLRGRRALGASDLAAALGAIADDPRGASRLLVVSDGIVTAGEGEIAGVRAAAERVAAAGIRRADALLDGGIQDAAPLKAITAGALPLAGVVADGRLPSAALAKKLGAATLTTLKVEVPGAAWVWPEAIEGAQPGDEALIFADLPEGAAMTVALTGEARVETTAALSPAERPLLERAWVRAQIARLQAERAALPTDDGERRAAAKQAIIELSTRYRVLSDFTALLVLETEADYARFKIDRAALADILSVGAEGVSVIRRAEAPKEPEPAQEMAVSVRTVEAKADRAEDTQEKRKEARAASEEEADAAAPAAPTQLEEGALFALPAPSRSADMEAREEPAAPGGVDDAVWGGLQGTEVGEAFGVGGLGLVGTGRGGGGVGEEVGLGSIGLIGRGGGSGTGSGYGRGAGAGFGGRGSVVPTVRQAAATVEGALDRDIIRRIVRAHINEVRHCYNQGLARLPELRGRVAVRFVITNAGEVASSVVQETDLRDITVANCIAQAAKRWRFPRPTGDGVVLVTYPFVLEPGGRDDEEERRPRGRIERGEEDERAPRRPRVEPYTGEFLAVHERLRAGDRKGALALALAWRDKSPGDVLALVAVGDAAEALGDLGLAARAFGSIIDLFPSRADLRRFAGARLEALRDAGSLALAIDTYAKAAESRPDHPSSHRLLALAKAQAGDAAGAFAAIERGLEQRYPDGRFAGVDRILSEDLGILGAAWIAADPQAEADVRARLAAKGAALATAPSTRFVLNWETDANDVDFHIRDGRGGHAWYSKKELASGGELFADVTTGYGPECFAIPGRPRAFPYRVEAHYYSRGPMGYGMGKLEILSHDGKGGLRFDQRPFVIMQDGAFVDLGQLKGPL